MKNVLIVYRVGCENGISSNDLKKLGMSAKSIAITSLRLNETQCKLLEWIDPDEVGVFNCMFRDDLCIEFSTCIHPGTLMPQLQYNATDWTLLEQYFNIIINDNIVTIPASQLKTLDVHTIWESLDIDCKLNEFITALRAHEIYYNNIPNRVSIENKIKTPILFEKGKLGNVVGYSPDGMILIPSGDPIDPGYYYITGEAKSAPTYAIVNTRIAYHDIYKDLLDSRTMRLILDKNNMTTVAHTLDDNSMNTFNVSITSDMGAILMWVEIDDGSTLSILPGSLHVCHTLKDDDRGDKRPIFINIHTANSSFPVIHREYSSFKDTDAIGKNVMRMLEQYSNNVSLVYDFVMEFISTKIHDDSK